MEKLENEIKLHNWSLENPIPPGYMICSGGPVNKENYDEIHGENSFENHGIDKSSFLDQELPLVPGGYWVPNVAITCESNIVSIVKVV